MREKWLKWATEIQSIAQAGLAYSKDKYDLERFEQLLDLSAEIISEYKDVELKPVQELVRKEEGYLTPKVDVRGAIIKENKILLAKESIDGCWSLPGGWADVNLSVAENIKKEAREEAGAIVEPKRIIAVLDRNRHNTPISIQSIYKIFVLCDYIEGSFKENIETEECGFFALDELPPLSTGRNNKEQIEMCFRAYEDENLKVIFD